jgi:hypothetical protein
MGNIMSEARNIEKVNFSHCGRDTNAAAHEFARNSFSSNTSYNWVDESLSFFVQTLLNDVTVV